MRFTITLQLHCTPQGTCFGERLLHLSLIISKISCTRRVGSSYRNSFSKKWSIWRKTESAKSKQARIAGPRTPPRCVLATQHKPGVRSLHSLHPWLISLHASGVERQPSGCQDSDPGGE